MNGLLHLKTEDFYIRDGTKGKILCHKVPNFSVILFYSPVCEHCQRLMPMFKTLPSAIHGVSFGIVNVSSSKDVIGMAKATVSPVRYVPYIVLYVDGVPYMSYKGENTSQGIGQFIVEVINNIQKKQSFTNNKVQKERKSSIPQYTIGQPIKGFGKDTVTYLEFDGTSYHHK